MKTRRVGAYNGIYRLYDPRRETLSVRLWFDRSRAEKAAKRTEAQRQQTTLFRHDETR